MPINPILFFITAILPYIAIIVLVNGLLYRLYKWMSKPKAPASFTIFPASKNIGKAFTKVLGDILYFPRLLREEKALWLGAWLFHLSLLMVVISHYKVFYSYMWFWENLNVSADTFALISDIFDGAAGVIMAASLVFLLGRRFTKFLRKLSVFEDYFALLLILVIAIAGIYIRFISRVNLLGLRRYFLSLAMFAPSNLPTDTGFLVHYLLIMILAIYFPLGKMVHTIGAGITSLLVRLEKR